MKNLHQNIKCKLCNSNNTYFFIESSDYRLKTSNNFFKLYKCLDCDFIFQNQKSLSAYKYEGNFFTKLESFMREKYEGYQWQPDIIHLIYFGEYRYY